METLVGEELEMELPGRRRRGRPKRRLMDAVKEDMQVVENSDSLWRPLKKGKAIRKRRRILFSEFIYLLLRCLYSDFHFFFIQP